MDEWRRIREEQDREYEESLAIDRGKVGIFYFKFWDGETLLLQVEEAETNARKARLLRELREQLLKKNYGADRAAGGISVSFRFKCGKVDHTFPSTCTVKVQWVQSRGYVLVLN